MDQSCETCVERRADFGSALAVLRALARRIDANPVERQIGRVLPSGARDEDRAPPPERPRVVAALDQPDVPHGIHALELCVPAVGERGAQRRPQRDALPRLDRSKYNGEVFHHVNPATLIGRRHAFQEPLDSPLRSLGSAGLPLRVHGCHRDHQRE